MSLLVAGVLLWSVAHLFKAVAPETRDRVERRLGNGPYRGLFSLVIIGSLVLIVLGWKNAMPKPVYLPPLPGGPVVAVLVLLGFVLFFAAQFAGNIKRFIRHPQMTGTLLWSIAHLLANGDSRSVLLFGTFGVWAALEITLINRRDGPRPRPPAAPIRLDVIPIVIGTTVFLGVFYFHRWLFGVAAF